MTAGADTALADLRVVEFGAIGPAPFAGMLLADFGADIVRIDRPGAGAQRTSERPHFLNRGRRSVALDLKGARGRDLALGLIDRADVVMEGFRPGVAERLGLGPGTCLERNPRLVYGRMTGWGQDGPLAMAAGHDLSYLAMTGVLGALGAPGTDPPPPLNVIGDFGGGGMFLALGILLALQARERSGRGQVVDAAIVDGVNVLATTVADLRAAGLWRDERASNIMDGGAPYYRTYATSDGRHMAVAAVEPQFYSAFLKGLGLVADEWPQHDRSRWPIHHEVFAARFATRDRDAWTAVFTQLDACVAPVLDWEEAATHAHTVARATQVEAFGYRQPAPAPRLSVTPGRVAGRAPRAGEHGAEVLRELGLDDAEIARLAADGVVGLSGGADDG